DGQVRAGGRAFQRLGLSAFLSATRCLNSRQRLLPARSAAEGAFPQQGRQQGPLRDLGSFNPHFNVPPSWYTPAADSPAM
ncbi:hypothetical protein, partial [Cupriavidus taiwanensis]|uniref:hypothetical protein n=1 Tax=Cupriavidus taiwanensis TaxID=164546 RepID=UPI001F11B6FB